MTRAASLGRIALLDVLDAEVERAREQALRLSVAVARPGAGSERELERSLLDLSPGPVYAVRPGAYAVVLPGTGRAEALGILAKLEARCGAQGSAVELEPGESAIALVVRLLGAAP